MSRKNLKKDVVPGNYYQSLLTLSKANNGIRLLSMVSCWGLDNLYTLRNEGYVEYGGRGVVITSSGRERLKQL